MFGLNKRDPVSYPSKKQEEKIKMREWKEHSDPIKVFAYDIMIYFKILLILLIVYISVLTFSECIFTWDSIGDNAVGQTSKGVQRPWLSNPTYHISSQNQLLELSPEIINL